MLSLIIWLILVKAVKWNKHLNSSGLILRKEIPAFWNWMVNLSFLYSNKDFENTALT